METLIQFIIQKRKANEAKATLSENKEEAKGE